MYVRKIQISLKLMDVKITLGVVHDTALYISGQGTHDGTGMLGSSHTQRGHTYYEKPKSFCCCSSVIMKWNFFLISYAFIANWKECLMYCFGFDVLTYDKIKNCLVWEKQLCWTYVYSRKY